MSFSFCIGIRVYSSVEEKGSVSWSPSIGAEAGWKADDLGYFSNSFYADLDISLLSISVDGKHNVSLPFSFGYASEGNEYLFERKQEELLFAIEAVYSYRFSDLFSLGIGAGIRGTWHFGTRHLTIAAGGSVTPEFHVIDCLSIIIPVSIYGSGSSFTFTAGAGISYRFMEGL